MNEYTDLKVAWYLDRIVELRTRKFTVPVHVQLILSDLCNENCNFCAYRMKGYTSNQHFAQNGVSNPARFIPYEKCIEIIDDLSDMGVESIEFTGGGEPTVHARHLEVFDYALSKGLKCALVTNGVLLRKGWEEVYPRFSWIRLSLDAGTRQTYSIIKDVTPSRYFQVLENASKISSQIRVSGSSCVFGTSFIVTVQNYHEIEEAASRAKASGAQSIRYGAIFTPLLSKYYSPELLEEIQAHIDCAKAEFSSDHFRVVDMFGQRVNDLVDGSPDYKKCWYQTLNVYIGGDLNVYRCCNTAYNDLGLIGSIKDQRFSHFWGVDQTRQAYVGFDPSQCQHCAFNGKNRILNYLADPNPLHKEFV